mgnify:CR=1 FL=1
MDSSVVAKVVYVYYLTSRFLTWEMGPTGRSISYGSAIIPPSMLQMRCIACSSKVVLTFETTDLSWLSVVWVSFLFLLFSSKVSHVSSEHLFSFSFSGFILILGKYIVRGPSLSLSLVDVQSPWHYLLYFILTTLARNMVFGLSSPLFSGRTTSDLIPILKGAISFFNLAAWKREIRFGAATLLFYASNFFNGP